VIDKAMDKDWGNDEAAKLGSMLMKSLPSIYQRNVFF
jgi:hypothetical protein